MTRKDYELIAKILKRSVTNKSTPEIEYLISGFYNILKNGNNKFDQVRFINYISGGGLHDKY